MAADAQITCPHCGVTQGGTQFCAECGGALPKAGEAAAAAANEAAAEAPASPLAAAAPAPVVADKPSDAKPNLTRTMMGVSAEQLFGKGGPVAAKPASGATPQGAFGASSAANASGATASSAGASTIAGAAGPLTAAAAPAPKPAEPSPAVTPPAVAAAPDAAASGQAEPNALTPAEAFAAERPRRSLSKTMMGISPETLGALRAAEAAKQPVPASGAQPAQANPAQPAPVQTAPAQPPAVPQPVAAGRANPMARTMLGLSPLGATPPGTPNPPEKLPFDASTGTMQGLPPVTDPGAHLGRGAMAKTMLGMAPPGAKGGGQPAAAGAPVSGQAQAAGPALGGRTMLGVPHGDGSEASGPELRRDAVRAATSARAAAETERVATVAVARGDGDQRATLPPRREVKALWPLMAVTLVVVTLTLFLVLPSSRPPHVDVSAKIVSTETGEALLFEVPSVVAGSKIRFGGQEKPLEAGRASFALAADSLRVGDNLVLADVVRPESEPAPVRITLAVSYRIWVDTAALRAERSSLDVVITALPGTHVTLEGEELKLDEAGRGVRSYPVDVVGEAKSGVIDHVVHYRVQPPSGETVVDELRTRIPVAMMQIDRPGREVTTDRDSIEIAGAAGKDTQVHLDKLQLPVKDGRFLYRLMLPEPGEYKPRLVASATGKAPFGVQLSIRRVKDLGQAAAQFVATPDLNYAKLAPNPAIYRGQRMSLEGRVYAVDPRGADSVIQMFVRPCPSSRRCPLWVSDPHGTEVNVDAWIKVLGVVQGEQQFRSEKNEIVTVPKVEAQFVLPAAP